MLYHMFCQF